MLMKMGTCVLVRGAVVAEVNEITVRSRLPEHSLISIVKDSA